MKQISCHIGQEPNYIELRNHFVENALLAEYRKGMVDPVIKSIDIHMEEIKIAFRNHKFLSEKGFF